jgi:PleD family two-component response regulator
VPVSRCRRIISNEKRQRWDPGWPPRRSTKLERMSLQAVTNSQLHTPTNSRSHVRAVDDDPMIREAISDYLGQYSFRVTAVADGGRPG